MSEVVQQALLKYLRENAEFYRTNRKIFIPPAERAAKVKFYEESAKEVRRLVDSDVELYHIRNPFRMNGGL